ncbi:MAG: efflux RND transporter periplasmic adaptor subunit [Acidobacteriia bacterium]|nr:efflux RND transporter periplasmic adaptor subunit [Terriglobia bacterium]
MIAVVACIDPLRFDLADTRAKLRSDLEIRPETSDPHSPVVVKDPLSRRFYRFTWVQATVLARLDGLHNAGAVAGAASEQCQVKVETSQVEDFIDKLQDLLLLDNASSWSRLEKLSKRRHRLLDSVLSIKIHASNPDRLLTRMEARLGRFFFGPGFQVLGWASIAAGAILSLVNWDQLVFTLPQIFTLYSIPLILMVAFTVMTIHEFGHALTLKHFGGKVEEMGLLVLYLIPGFYCNVSDAWLLKKRERMLVSCAGGFIQLVLWSWATIAWRLLSPETLGSRICLITIAFSGIQTLFNFNPLLRLDGYYLLSDYLEVPNLRQKSFGYLKRRLSYLLIGTGRRSPFLTARERRIFVLYGVSSFAFSAGLLLILLGRLGAWMVGQYQTWGILLFSVVCLMVVPVTSRENIAAAGKLAGGVGTRIRKAPYLLIGAAIVLAAGFFPWELKVTGDFVILPGKTVGINPDVEGTLRSIYVDEGSQVKKGDVLAEIQNLVLSNAYEETRGQLASSRASLNLLKAGKSPEEIERAQRAVETRRTDLENAGRVDEERRLLLDTVAKKEAELQNAQSIFERSQSLFLGGLIAKNELERNQTAFAVAQKELAEAKGQLKVLEERTDRDRLLRTKALAEANSELKILLAGSRKESIQAVEADVARLEEKLSILEQQLEHLKIRSSIDGVVSTPYLKNKLGAYIEKGNLFCQVVDVRLVILDMPVPEKEIADVAVGYPIVVKVSAFSKRPLNAQVKSISPIAVEGAQERKVVVRGELLNADGSLKAGMTGVGKILCGKRMIGELVTRRAIRWLRTEFWEYLP